MSLRLKRRVLPLSDVLHERSLFAERAIVFNSQNRNAAAAEVRHQYIVTRLVDGEITGAGPSRRQCVQQAQFASGRIDGKRAHVGPMIEIRTERRGIFGRDVEESLVGVNRKERGINHLGGKLWFTDFPCCRMETADIDSLAVASSGRQAFRHIGKARVGAKIHEVLARCRGGTPGTRNKKYSPERE
jgi:hypothetical protein